MSDQIICIFCHAKGNFGTHQVSQEYLDHLVAFHNINYELDLVTEQTVKLNQSKTFERKSRKALTIAWHSGCEYQCRVENCSHMFFTPNDLKKHVEKRHAGVEEYLKRFDRFETKAVFLKCNKCGSEMKREHASIQKHLMENHDGLDIKDYQDKYKLKDYQAFVTDQDNPIVKPEPRPQLETTSLTIKDEPVDDDDDSDNLSENSYPVESLTKPDHVVVQEKDPLSIDESDDSKTYFDKTPYECRICLEHVESIDASRKHLKRLHNVTLNTDNKSYGDTLVRQVPHKCMICQNSVSHDRDVFDKHVKSHHDMSIEQYINEYIKNQAEDDEPATKKAKFELKIPWFCGCEYQCQVENCLQMFYTNNCLCQHITKHHFGLDEYWKQHHRFETKAVFLKCNECGQQVKRYYASVQEHLLVKHKGMTMKEYQDKYHMSNYAVPLPVGAKSSIEVELFSRPPPLTHNKDEVDEELVVFSKELIEWGSQCKMECKMCLKQFTHFVSAVKHINYEHALTIPKYTKMYGTIYTNRVKHVCMMCREQVTHDLVPLRRHLEQCHQKMRLQDYYVKYVSKSSHQTTKDDSAEYPSYKDVFEKWKNPSIYECAMCGFLDSGSQTFSRHLKAKHDLTLETYVSKYRDPMQNPKTHICKICKKRLRQEQEHLFVHQCTEHRLSLWDYYNKYVRLQQPQFSWMNASTFKCVLCKNILTSRREFENHVDDIHNITMQEYIRSSRGDSGSVRKIYKCIICKGMVEHSDDAISTHLKTKHNMEPEQYHYQHVQKQS